MTQNHHQSRVVDDCPLAVAAAKRNQEETLTTDNIIAWDKDLANTSVKAQCSRLLAYLRHYHKITTIEAQEKLNIYDPPARIFALRQAGFDIKTEFVYRVNAQGFRHKVGRYVLLSDHTTHTPSNHNNKKA